MPEITPRDFTAGTIVTFSSYGEPTRGIVQDPASFTRLACANYGDSYVLVYRDDRNGWDGTLPDGTRLNGLYWVRPSELTRVVLGDPQVLTDRAREANRAALASVATFRATTGQRQAFRAYKSATEAAAVALDDLARLVVENL